MRPHGRVGSLITRASVITKQHSARLSLKSNHNSKSITSIQIPALRESPESTVTSAASPHTSRTVRRMSCVLPYILSACLISDATKTVMNAACTRQHQPATVSWHPQTFTCVCLSQRIPLNHVDTHARGQSVHHVSSRIALGLRQRQLQRAQVHGLDLAREGPRNLGRYGVGFRVWCEFKCKR